MQRTNIYLTEEQQQRLKERAREEGVSKSSLIRRILDEGLGLTRATVSTTRAIRDTSGLWADRDEDALQDVLQWRREEPLERLT